MKTIHCGGMVGGTPNQFFDFRLIGSHSWRGEPKFGSPINDLESGDADNLKANVANIFPGGGAANQGIDCYQENYPPYAGDVTLLGQRLDAGGGANDGTFVYVGTGAHSCAQTVLVYWNQSEAAPWAVPAHRLRINRTTIGVFQPWIPAMIVPPNSRRTLFVMADLTVIAAADEFQPVGGLDAVPLYVPNDDNVWCSPLEFIYDRASAPGEGGRAPCKRLQNQSNGQRINTVLHARMNLERNIVCGVLGKDGIAFVTLCYDFAQGSPADKFLKVALEARSCEYDGSQEANPWVSLTPITGPDEFIDATGKVTPPGSGRLFDVKFLLGFSTLPEAPPELEFRFKRIGRHVDDNAEYIDFLAGGYGAWFWSPYLWS